MLSLAFALELYWLAGFGPAAVLSHVDTPEMSALEMSPALSVPAVPIGGRPTVRPLAAPPPGPAYSLERVPIGADCVLPANLPYDPTLDYIWRGEGVPADLPGQRYVMPESFSIDLEIFLAEPAPFGATLDVGDAEIETETGRVTLDGEVFALAMPPCP